MYYIFCTTDLLATKLDVLLHYYYYTNNQTKFSKMGMHSQQHFDL